MGSISTKQIFRITAIENAPTLANFGYFRSLQQQFWRKNVDFSWIRNQIARVEGKRADHLTTNTAPMGHPRPFLLISSFHTIFTKNKCEKYPSSIRCWDLNPWPSKHESPHITTSPGLPPRPQVFLILFAQFYIWHWFVKRDVCLKRTKERKV